MIKCLIFDRGDTIIIDLPENYGGMEDWPYYIPVDGVIETIPTLYKKYNCIIASNTSVSTAKTIYSALRKMKLDKYFKYVFTQNELGCAKPDKDFFINILHILKIKPSESCMIGNSYKLDIIPAKEIGIHTILLTSKKGKYLKADYVTNNFKDLITIINNLNKIV